MYAVEILPNNFSRIKYKFCIVICSMQKQNNREWPKDFWKWQCRSSKKWNRSGTTNNIFYRPCRLCENKLNIHLKQLNLFIILRRYRRVYRDRNSLEISIYRCHIIFCLTSYLYLRRLECPPEKCYFHTRRLMIINIVFIIKINVHFCRG